MPAIFSPLPTMIATHELASGDLIVRPGGEMAFFLTVPDQYSARPSRCALDLLTFELAQLHDPYACLVTRDFVIAVDPSRAAKPDIVLTGGEVTIVVNGDGPSFVTNSGKDVAVDLAGSKSRVVPGMTAVFPHWTIAIADGFGGRREIYAR